MEQIVEQLKELNTRDVLDIVAILLPLILTATLIIQNHAISKRNDVLQRQIHNRDMANSAHDDILRIYRTYYDFCDTVVTSNFSESVRHADVAFANMHFNEILNLKRRILQNLDLARLLFSQQDTELFSVVEDRFNSEIAVLDKFHDYIFSGELARVSENAWDTVMASVGNTLYKDLARYDYMELGKDLQRYKNFVALCNTNEVEEITEGLDVIFEKHSYENYGGFFEKYLCLEKI